MTIWAAVSFAIRIAAIGAAAASAPATGAPVGATAVGAPADATAVGTTAAGAPVGATAAGATAAPGVATLDVDATQAPRGIMSAHLELPIPGGPITLVYPKWLPGRHSPAGPLTSLGGPCFTVDGRPVTWHRDPVDLNAFHVDVPAGATRLSAELEILTSPAPDGVVQGLETPRTATESLLILEWNQLLLYPAGTASDDWPVRASVKLPDGWKYATALRAGGAEGTAGAGPARIDFAPGGAARGAGAAPARIDFAPGGAARDAGAGAARIDFAPTTLTTLVDSTLLAGRYFRDVPLGGTPAVTLHIAADIPVALTMSAATEAHYRQLVREAAELFGATHYDRYEFLWALTDQIMPDGLEHHESSDDRSPLRALVDDPIRRAEANLLPHEYIHSWNGKYRRPSAIATPDYQVPMQDELLWVYEGLTEYLSDVLSVRSGLFTETEFREELARIAAAMDSHTAREWRSLEETTTAAPLLYYQSRNWAARLRRQDDFYQESALLWLEADTVIRRESKGRRSLDDFCRRFFGPPTSGPRLVTYDFAAVMQALNAVQPYDWSAFWRERLTRLRPGAPLEGVRAAGWRLALTDTPSSMHVAHEADDKDLDVRYSLGFFVDDDGATLGDIIPRSPADAAGASPGSHLIALNGYKWSKELLHDTLAVPRTEPLTLLIEKDQQYKTLELRYGGGEQFPTLVRDGTLVDILAQIARPRACAPRCR